NIFEGIEDDQLPYEEKSGKIANSDFLNGLEISQAIKKAIEVLEERKLGQAKVNYRLRDAVFSRQRYWGEPFPIYFSDDIAKTIDDEFLPITLPEVDNYKPTPDGLPPLGNATNW